ncbi:hypothetical protein SERLA73DRAFT_185710 [Serpula lacrymans var. lacrymans S7.3]|uniref:Mini-chromosome maintenance complex-binding protein n=2 Tax=Serpula lacrymans var. lacrymans TaxID=341189 RepID=F8Q699_SERL3|nr:uncharacterized protein SERLADRAFT_474372 [Serpula lacrymans var. lacrymans S7.9]EGN96137.1 hypothetical protein SERLA73DRAFT_185710 [Serpula lacrymans var. lacrymans S7.3]EGO21675.1 hypothetical protein SERLADRAFT_474372 [Serpula lacrymans var. lacrymans S7.9]
MVSALLVDALKSPTSVLQDFYNDKGNITGHGDEFPKAVSKYFSDILLKTRDTVREVPYLSVINPPESFPERSLVRFRAMVQDTSASPEMYLAKLKGNKCGGWGNTEDLAGNNTAHNIDYSSLRECTVLWAVSIPGETAWHARESESSNTSQHTSHQPSQPHKFPIPGAAHVGVQVKIYDHSAAQNIKPTDIVNFVGILTSEPIYLEMDSPPEVPTLHVLFHEPQPAVEKLLGPPVPNISETRDNLINWISKESLGGDRDAAEWVLLAIIARVKSRTPPLLPPPLTLSRFPQPRNPSSIPSLTHVLSEIVPMFITVPLTLDVLNQNNFAPESREEILHSGLLQVPRGTNFLFTESGIQEGRVVEKGVMNVKAVQEVMNAQSLEYVFPYSRFSFQTDMTFIVLSEGRKSAFFQTSINIPLQIISSENVYRAKDQIKMPATDELIAFRRLVAGAKAGNVQVADKTSTYIQDDFVEQRKRDNSITVDDLIHLMTVARLLALSLYESELSTDVWKRAKELESRRKLRLR